MQRIQVRREIWALYLFNALTGVHFSSAIIIPFFLQWGGLSYSQIYLLQSWFLFWSIALEIPTGVLADRFGKKLLLMLGVGVGACGLCMFGLFSNAYLFFVAEFLLAFSAASVSGASEALLYELSIAHKFPENGKEIFGKSHVFKTIGALIAAPIGSFVAAHADLTVPMLMDAVALLGALFALMAINEPANAGSLEIKKSSMQLAKQGAKFFLYHSNVQKIAFLMVAISIASHYAIWLYQPLLNHIEIPLEYYGWFSSLFFGVQILIASNFALIEKKIPSIEKYIWINILFTATVFALVLQFPSWATILLFIITGSHATAQLRYITAHINQWIPFTQRATTLSFLNMLQSLFIFALNPLVGVVMDRSLSLGLLTVIFVMLLFALISFTSEIRPKIL